MELQNDPIRTTFQRFKECRICSRFSIDLADLFYVLSLIRQDAPFAEFPGLGDRTRNGPHGKRCA
ncbi:hypothetical protein LEP1GSC108_0984 [Leptospira weilii str. UI 13098]|uniref:Uncharacterized protein n=1 Tax=Leptospira weilii str. UI 13098 TaxID=1088542 RepID=M6Q7L7_9LEPT|nr:hypothetical protein LEP1GSC108_0984 [Leptospira weilii str. UI 13098]